MPQSWESYIRGEEEAHTPPSEVSIDLKWSLWTTSMGIWMDYAPEALAALRACPEYLKIYTAPRKEIRFGEVTLECVESASCEADTPEAERYNWIASVCFRAEWDESTDLMDTLGVPCAAGPDGHWSETEIDLFEESIMDLRNPSIEREIVAGSLEEFLAKVDAVEEELLALDEQNWKAAEEMFKKEE